MNTLLIRLAGPMQSWGVESRFGVRDTGRDPSKSGVIGLICAALGRSREAQLNDLSELCMGVRVDREGSLKVDYHTAQNVLKAGGGIKETELSNRYYLSDAAFLVGLESKDMELLSQIYAAIKNPHWPLCLGRKAFVPSPPVYLHDGLKQGKHLLEALISYPYIGRGELPRNLRIVMDDPEGEVIRPDMPISFAERTFALRRISNRFVDLQPLQVEVA